MSDDWMSDGSANVLILHGFMGRRALIANQPPPRQAGRHAAAAHTIVGRPHTMVGAAAHTIATEGGHPDFRRRLPPYIHGGMISADAPVFGLVRSTSTGPGNGSGKRRDKPPPPQPTWTVRCPHCGAAPGADCVSVGQARPRIIGHSARRRAERAAHRPRR